MRRAKDAPGEVILKLIVRQREHPALYAELVDIPTGAGRRVRLIGLVSIALALERGFVAAPRLAAHPAAPPVLNGEGFDPERELKDYPVSEGGLAEVDEGIS